MITSALFGEKVTSADSDLLVYPTHVVMTDRQRTAQVDMINSSQTQASYKITLVRKRMTETGAFQNVSTASQGEKFADDLVKFSPRQVTLVPGAGQTVRIMFKVPPELAEGEYRSHLVFTKVPSAISDMPTTATSEGKTFSMRITANFGVSIPVIARHGKLEAHAAIDPQSVKISKVAPNQQEIGFVLSRTGTRSIYGDIVVFRGDEKVAIGNGFSVYTPNTRRQIALPILDPYKLKTGDTVRVVFTEKDEKEPMAATTAEIR
jgi:P pilus assembly chaperone PapD